MSEVPKGFTVESEVRRKRLGDGLRFLGKPPFHVIGDGGALLVITEPDVVVETPSVPSTVICPDLLRVLPLPWCR